MADWQEWTLRLTVVLVVTSFVLLLPGLSGIGASPTLAIALGGLSLAVFSLRDTLHDLPTVAEHDLGLYGRDLWLAPLLAIGAIVFFPGASPAELQSLGGIAGFAGMVNYFLRPIYLLGYSTLRSLVTSPS